MTNIPNQISTDELQLLLETAAGAEQVTPEQFKQQVVREVSRLIEENTDILSTQLKCKLAVLMLLNTLKNWASGNCEAAAKADRTSDALTFCTINERFEQAFDLIQCTQVSHDDFTVSDDE